MPASDQSESKTTLLTCERTLCQGRAESEPYPCVSTSQTCEIAPTSELRPSR